MKTIFTLLLLTVFTLEGISQQNYTSENNRTADWTDYIWTKSASWMQDRPDWGYYASGFGYWHNAHVYGYLTLNDNMNVANGATLHVHDTLRITGNLISQQNITVYPGGILIVEGDMDTYGGGNNNIQGTVVVLGDVTARNGGDINVSGDFYMFGSLTSPGSGEAYNGSGTPPAGYFGTESDLAGDNASLYAFAYGGTLPVKFAGVELKKDGNSVKVHWATAEELNNDFFTIERSQDGRHFYAIGQVNGQGTTENPYYYSFTDQDPLNGISYYRIHQTDFNGTTSYSEIVRYEVANSVLRYRVYPNPAVEAIHLHVETRSAYQVRLIDLAGAVQLDLTVKSSGSSESAIDTRNMERGYYLLEITTAEKRITERVLLK